MKKIILLLIVVSIIAPVFARDHWDDVACDCLTNSFACSSGNSYKDLSNCGGCNWDLGPWSSCSWAESLLTESRTTTTYGPDCCTNGICWRGCDGCPSFQSHCVHNTYECRWWWQQPASGNVICRCDSGFKDCNLNAGDGCEQYIATGSLAHNNCGECGNDCGDAPCYNGQCLNDNEWAYCKINCNCVGDDLSYSGNAGTEYNVYQENECGGSCYRQDNSAFCHCDNNHIDCNGASGGLDGCETNKLDMHTCGSCNNNCVEDGCSGSQYLGYTSEIDILSVCQINCGLSGSTYRCYGLTKEEGHCESNIDCDGYQAPVTSSNVYCQKDLEGDGWCCPDNMCGKNGDCVSQYEEWNFEGEYFVCDYKNDGDYNVQWIGLTKTISLGKMIQYNHGEDIDNDAFFTDSGITTDCNGEYSVCSYDGPYYAYQYCSQYSTVFDGMFNLELPMNVPVYVSEQELYDPYGNTELEFDVDCSVGGGLNCAR